MWKSRIRGSHLGPAVTPTHDQLGAKTFLLQYTPPTKGTLIARNDLLGSRPRQQRGKPIKEGTRPKQKKKTNTTLPEFRGKNTNFHHDGRYSSEELDESEEDEETPEWVTRPAAFRFRLSRNLLRRWSNTSFSDRKTPQYTPIIQTSASGRAP